jgi:hypothetical protein
MTGSDDEDRIARKREKVRAASAKSGDVTRPNPARILALDEMSVNENACSCRPDFFIFDTLAEVEEWLGDDEEEATPPKSPEPVSELDAARRRRAKVTTVRAAFFSSE